MITLLVSEGARPETRDLESRAAAMASDPHRRGLHPLLPWEHGTGWCRGAAVSLEEQGKGCRRWRALQGQRP